MKHKRGKKKNHRQGQVSKLRRMISLSRPESKFVDNSGYQQLQTWTASFYYLNNIAEGTSVNQRVGRKIKLTSFLIRYNWNTSIGVASAAMDQVRIMLVRDTEYNGVLPTTGQMLAATGSGIVPFAAMNQITTQNRFRVIWDYSTYLDSTGHQLSQKKYIRFKRPIECNFIGLTNGFVDGGKNSLFLVAMSDTNPVNNGPALSFYCRLRYTDA